MSRTRTRTTLPLPSADARIPMVDFASLKGGESPTADIIVNWNVSIDPPAPGAGLYIQAEVIDLVWTTRPTRQIDIRAMQSLADLAEDFAKGTNS